MCVYLEADCRSFLQHRLGRKVQTVAIKRLFPQWATRVMPDGHTPSRLREGIEGEENAPQQDSRGGRLASDPQPVSRPARRTDLNERVKTSAKQPADKVGNSRKQLWPISDSKRIAFATCASDLLAFEMLSGATWSERERLFAQMITGTGRLLRALIANGQPRTQIPRRPKPQLPEVGIEEAAVRHPAPRNIGP